MSRWVSTAATPSRRAAPEVGGIVVGGEFLFSGDFRHGIAARAGVAYARHAGGRVAGHAERPFAECAGMAPRSRQRGIRPAAASRPQRSNSHAKPKPREKREKMTGGQTK